MFDGVLWWSAWRRCYKVCSHLIICCFLSMYRSVQVIKHCIESLLHGSSLLFYVSPSARLIGDTINWRYRLSVLHDWASSLNLGLMSTTVLISTFVLKRPSLSLDNNTMINFSPRRSKRGAEKKANYPNTRDKRSLFAMPEKRVPSPGLKRANKKWLNWIHVCRKLHSASSGRLCFVNQVNVMSCINYITNGIDNSIYNE